MERLFVIQAFFSVLWVMFLFLFHSFTHSGTSSLSKLSKTRCGICSPPTTHLHCLETLVASAHRPHPTFAAKKLQLQHNLMPLALLLTFSIWLSGIMFPWGLYERIGWYNLIWWLIHLLIRMFFLLSFIWGI